MDLRAAAGTFVAASTVPPGKVWRVKALHRDVTIAVSLMMLATTGIDMPVSGLGTADEFVTLPDIRLSEDEQVGMITSGDAGDNPVKMLVAVEEEDVF